MQNEIIELHKLNLLIIQRIFEKILVLQRLAEFIRLHLMRCYNVSYSLGIIFDNIHCNTGAVLGRCVS